MMGQPQMQVVQTANGPMVVGAQQMQIQGQDGVMMVMMQPQNQVMMQQQSMQGTQQFDGQAYQAGGNVAVGQPVSNSAKG